MARPVPLRLTPNAAAKEKRLAALLGGRDPRDPRLLAAVEAAALKGSLELAGIPVSLEEVRAAQRGDAARPEVAALVRARRAVPAGEPFTVRALMTWHFEATGAMELRAGPLPRPQGPPSAPPPFIASRLEVLEQWLGQDSAGELGPAQQGALVLARVLEVAPFAEGNGRTARLAASHLMVRAGGRPPVLESSDAARLEQALQAAFALQTEPLVTLLEDASTRGLEAMIAALQEEASPR